MLRLQETRCPKCGSPLREERAHYRCESCGIVEACCEGRRAKPEDLDAAPEAPPLPELGRSGLPA